MFYEVEPEEIDTAFFSKLSNKIVQYLPKQIVQCMFPSEFNHLCDFTGWKICSAMSLSLGQRKSEQNIGE